MVLKCSKCGNIIIPPKNNVVTEGNSIELINKVNILTTENKQLQDVNEKLQNQLHILEAKLEELLTNKAELNSVVEEQKEEFVQEVEENIDEQIEEENKTLENEEE